MYELDEEAEPFAVKTLFETFKTSDQYKELPKVEKQNLSMKIFLDEKIRKNPHLAKYIMLRGKTHKGVQCKVDSIIGWNFSEK